MNQSIKTTLLVTSVGIAGILIGRAITSKQQGGASPISLPDKSQQMKNVEAENSAKLSSEPRRTFIGPDGKSHLIEYNQDARAPGKQGASSRRAVLDGILSDMRHHPKLTGANYEMSDAQVAEFLKTPEKIPRQVESTLPAK